MRHLGAILLFLVACSTSQPRPSAVEPPKDEDWVRLQNGETLSGKIVSSGENGVVIDTGAQTRHIAGKHVVDFGVSNQTLTPEPAPVLPPTSWYPRVDPKAPVEQVEITFFAPHPLRDCVGDLEKSVLSLPEGWLFVEPGGKVVVEDPKKWGYHAHVGEVLQCPEGKPGLSIEMPSEELPEGITLVSPAQEMKAGERTCYAIPDALHFVVKDASQAEAALSAQPFTGGTARDTGMGRIWCFATPRNDRQFLLFILDPSGKHGEVLGKVYATYGEAVLAPDLVIDSIAANGRTIGRTMVLPMPSNLSADGPAPEAVAVRVGHGAGLVTTAAVPPRQAMVVPVRPPSTVANVYVSHYQVSNAIRQGVVVAYGTTKEATVRTRELTKESSEEHVRIDLASLPAERFPAVAWFYHRRSYLWKDGGRLEPTGPMVVPLAREEKPTKVISNAGRIPHVLPILFVGPNPKVESKGDSEALVAGGMASGLLAESLRREAGLPDILNTIGSLSSIAETGAGVTQAGHSSTASSVTNIYITIPPHTDTGLPGRLGSGSQIPLAFSDGGRKHPLQWQQFNDPLGRFGGSGQNAANYYDSSAGTWKQGYNSVAGSNQVTYDPATGSLIPVSSASVTCVNQPLGYDPINGVITFGPKYEFRTRKK